MATTLAQWWTWLRSRAPTSWHGDLFEFVRNRVFNARNYFADTKDPLKRNQFGGTVGGPIHRNTTFMFFGWQKTIIRSVNNASNAVIPIPQNLTGDFSNYSTAGGATNPLGNKTATILNPYTHTAFSPNNIDSRRFNRPRGAQYDQDAANLFGNGERLRDLRHANPTEL